jgi:ethanolamine ammonia-lyase small subunit
MNSKDPVINNSWCKLRRYTDARIGLGRAGISQTTNTHLQFQLDHANARDAIHIPLDTDLIVEDLLRLGISSVVLNSRAENRTVYLQRPDLGRRLDSISVETIKSCKTQLSDSVDAIIVIADGLSSTAVHRHSIKLAEKIRKGFVAQKMRVSPICIVDQGRVAIGDEIGQLFNAQLIVMIIGERPGLSAPDSLGIYYTFMPKLGLTDVNRNCISNVRPAGMSIEIATNKLFWLINESLKRRISGVNLKDESTQLSCEIKTYQSNFLLQQR